MTNAHKQPWYSPEILLALYLHVFYYLKPFYIYLPLPSTPLIFGVTTGLVGIAFLTQKEFERFSLSRWLIFSGCLLALFIINLLLIPNPYQIKYAQEMLLYGLYPLFLLSLVTDFQTLLHWHILFSFVTGFLLLLEPFTNYALTGGYMTFGFALYMFSVTGLAAGYKLTHKWWYLVLFLVELVCIGVWGNKGAFLAGLVMLFILLFNRLNRLGKLLFLLLTGYFLTIYEKILNMGIELLMKLGFQTYALVTLQRLISEDSQTSGTVTSLRTDIWDKAVAFGWEHFLGSGIGTFETLNTVNPTFIIYPHNIFLDIFVTFGVQGLFVFIVLLAWSLIKTFQTQNLYLKLCRFGAFLGWFMPMQFSLTLWRTPIFWLYFGLVFLVVEDQEVMVYEA